MRRKELFYYVTWASNVTPDVHWCVTVDYQQIANDNIANQIHGFKIDYGKFILKINIITKRALFLSSFIQDKIVWSSIGKITVEEKINYID